MFKKSMALALCFAISFPFSIFADDNENTGQLNNIVVPERPERKSAEIVKISADSIPSDTVATDSILREAAIDVAQDSINAADSVPAEFERRIDFNPDPERAVWLSALCPGLGQIYNRRYWKLPIVVGGYVGLAYATSWNGRMLSDYTRAYRDIMDSDPNTKSYMDFYPSTTKESDIDKEWLTRSLKSKKDFYRRNRDLCIISMFGLYLICMVDAYVDASLSHFDISPDLSMQVAPAVISSRESPSKSFGVQCAFTF